jgi:hypothetical protein
VSEMGDVNRGLYEKYRVERTDGRSAPGEKHDGCRYFVLDVDHDRHAIPALLAYAESCKGEYPLLSRDVLLLRGEAILEQHAARERG